MRHIGETFFETNMEVLMCFVCGGKHMKHSGYDKFGNLKEKGDLSIRTGQRELEKILIGRQTSSDETAWDYNMSYKFFKDRFGAAVQSDPELQRNSPEWIRKTKRGETTADLVLPRGCEKRCCLPTPR